MNREDAAFLGGLFEGEGSFYSNRGVQPVAQFSMTDEDVVRRFHRLVGFGSVHRENGQNGHKTQWRWRTSKFENVQAFVAYVWPWLGERRRQRAKDVLAAAGRKRAK